MSKELIAALVSVTVEPCTAYSCSRRRDCADQKLACDSFVYYVTTGRSLHPLMTFQTSKQGQKPLNILKSPSNPTRKLYDRIFKPNQETTDAALQEAA